MSTQLAFVLVAAMCCVTFLIAFIFQKVEELKKASSQAREEYWRGRYFSLATVFDKGTGVSLSDRVIEALEELGVKIQKEK